MEHDDNQLSADAVHTGEPSRLQKEITGKDIEVIDTTLALYEKVSKNN